MRNIGLEFGAKGKCAFCDLGLPPELDSDEILLETLYTGVTNGTERHALLSEHGYGGGNYPSRHGYQHVGRIIAIGNTVTQYAIGESVFYGGYVGHNGWNIVTENALMIKLPATLEHKYCALFGVAAVALRAVRRMGVRPGDNVWVVGQGPIGQFIGQASRSAGAKVTVTDLIEHRLRVAEQCGAHSILDASDTTVWTQLSKGRPYDFIFDCCSAPSLLKDIHKHQLLAHGGTVGMMAVRDSVTYPWSLLHGTEAKIETSCHFDRDDLRVLLFLVEHGYTQIAPVVTHMVEIEEALNIYQLLAYDQESLLGVIFNWQS